MKIITVKRRTNGDQVFMTPIEGFASAHLVTLQKDGELRWASLGSLKAEDAVLFHSALSLALSFAGIKGNNIAGGITYQIEQEGVEAC